jgi:putative cell wall-binding protein
VQSCFAVDGTATGVVLARSDGFADALAGGPLASAHSGCLLLTPSDTLDARTLAEIQRVLPSGGKVFLLGGEAALSPGVASAVTAAGFDAVRLGGADRFETAVKIATDGLGSPSVVMIATGGNFPDALGAGPAASDRQGAILLSNGSSLPPSTASFLQAHPQETVFAIGGPAAAAVPSATAIVGKDRYETAVKIAMMFFPQPTDVGVASGLNFPDALAGGAGLGNLDGPILLTDPDALPQVVSDYLNANPPQDAFVFGGPAAVHESVVDQLKALLGP